MSTVVVAWWLVVSTREDEWIARLKFLLSSSQGREVAISPSREREFFMWWSSPANKGLAVTGVTGCKSAIWQVQMLQVQASGKQATDRGVMIGVCETRS